MAAAWERANRTRRFIGAHVSASGGVHNSPANAARIGATGFALFLKNQRQWACPALEDAVKDGFKEQIKALGYDFSSVIPHGSYLVNLGNRDKDKREKAYENFLDDLVRCEQLGIPHHNLHPGSTCGEITADESIRLIVDCIDRAHAATSSVIVVLENCAGHANTIGSFEDLGKICAQVKDKSRVGVCLDTCHAFAFGHDIRTKEAYEATMRSFEELVGFKYLRAVHLNDSKGELRCRKDRHENIGKGFIGIEGFRLLLNDPRFADIPLVLETPENAKDPVQGYRDEIDLLYSLIAA
ncbi:endonuclease 4 [Hyaloraphidium curvatum]|nr:endonuclease 4 [Hyaloraphidium curvatum]